MNQTEINNKPAVTAAVIFFMAALCQMPSMVKSGFLSRFGTEIFSSFAALTAFIFIAFRLLRTKSSAYTASFISVLLFGNWSQLMLYYTSNCDSMDIVKSVEYFMGIVLGSAVISWLFFIVMHKTRRSMDIIRHILFSLAAVGTSAFVLVFSGGGRNTSSTAGGFQPAILMMFLMLCAFAGETAINHKFWEKALYFVLFWLMTGSLAVRHEFGIPVMCCAACIFMYFFLNRSKSKKELPLILANITAPVIGLSAAMILDSSLRNDTLGKFNERIGDNHQWLTAKANLSASSLFGSETYDIYLPEASTDYSLNLNVHYWGFIWLALLIFAFFMMTVSVYGNIMHNDNDNFAANVKKMAYSAVCIIVVYNILDNICGFPVVGVQNICCGTSKSMAVLSGLLTGCAMAEPVKIRESVCAFLEKKKIIIASSEREIS